MNDFLEVIYPTLLIIMKNSRCLPKKKGFFSLKKEYLCSFASHSEMMEVIFSSGMRNKLEEMKIVLLGERSSGKSSTGNIILHKEVFSAGQDEQCHKEVRQVGDRQVTVIDTPGWRRESSCSTEQMDREIVRSLSLSESGVHAVLLVVPLDLKFTETEKVKLEEHVNLFGASIWKHTLVLFTHEDKLPNKSIEEHIEREESLRWLVDKCKNRYHSMNNRKSDLSQVTKLFEKIEEMVAANTGQLFCPNMNDVYLRISEKFCRIQLKNVLKQRLEKEYRRRELELMSNFKTTLLELQEDLNENMSRSETQGFREYYTLRSYHSVQYHGMLHIK